MPVARTSKSGALHAHDALTCDWLAPLLCLRLSSRFVLFVLPLD